MQQLSKEIKYGLVTILAFALLSGFAVAFEYTTTAQASSEIVSNTCTNNVCSAIVNLYDKQHVVAYSYDSDGDIDSIELLTHQDASRETVLQLKDVIVKADRHLQVRNAQGTQ